VTTTIAKETMMTKHIVVARQGRLNAHSCEGLIGGYLYA
jgi:hypothetical protein